MFNVSFTYSLFVCAIRFESKMQGGGDFIRGRYCFIGGSKFSSEGGFIVANLAPGRFYLTKWATFSGERSYFPTPVGQREIRYT